ncbi:putative serine/threonine-protein kinase PBS1-like [Capsicum annuum]|uniref:Glycosyl transferase 64 domain-containing protein n=1 Tax=Capsicum annuum TaxID=4072 RepID=A0A2G2ZW20_CAPAN|nr:putative serine/threonine-protein kinase PBS1-like [Capsicum annuum]PHT86190.1 hypothetical protein T459_08296 [Capsicum annuum]
MILTGAAFMVSKKAFELYWSKEAAAGREVVDSLFNCEDVLLNYLYANASFSSTVEYMKPAWAIDSSKFTGVAISKNTQIHYGLRSKCLQKFSEMYRSITNRKSEFNHRMDCTARREFNSNITLKIFSIVAYRRLGRVLALMWLIHLRIDYFLGSTIDHRLVNLLFQFMEHHWIGVKRILRYIAGTIELGLQLTTKSSLRLVGFFDADWGGCPLTRRSTTGICVFLGSNCISWSSKKQHTVAKSSVEVEYRSLASLAAEITRITYILHDISISLISPLVLFTDNISALHLTINPVLYARTKHVELNYHFVREKVVQGAMLTKFVPSLHQVADILTKPLTKMQFRFLRSKLGVMDFSISTLGGMIDI